MHYYFYYYFIGSSTKDVLGPKIKGRTEDAHISRKMVIDFSVDRESKFLEILLIL